MTNNNSNSNQLSQLESAIDAWQNSIANIRKPAEQFIEQQLKQNRDSFLQGLCQLLITSKKQTVRHLITILIRKRLATDDVPPVFCELKPETKQIIKQTLLRCAVSDPDKQTRNQIIDCITELAIKSCTFEQWNELLPWTVNLFHSNSTPNTIEDKINALQIFGYLCAEAYDNIRSKIDIILNCYQNAINHQNIKVKIAAIEAISLTIKSFDTDQTNLFKPLMPKILVLLENVIANEINSIVENKNKNTNDDEDVNDFEMDESAFNLTTALITILTEIASTEPLLFNTTIERYTLTMIQICMKSEFPDDVRTLALEFLVTLVQSDASMCRKSNTIAQAIVDICLNSFLLSLPSSEDWDEEEYGQDSDQNSLSSVAEYALDRVTHSLSIQFVLPLVLKQITNPNTNQSYLRHNDWHYRHCALSVITQISEYLQDDQLVIKFLHAVLGLFNDNNLQVCYCAINTIGQMCSDHPVIILQEEQFCGNLLTKMISLLETSKHPKIKAHTCACLLNFVIAMGDYSNNKVLFKYLDPLLKQLFETLNADNSRCVQEQALTAIASIASVSTDLFGTYYDSFATPLMQIVETATSPQFESMRARALECMGYMGKAVGNRKFEPHAAKLMPFTIAYFKSNDVNSDNFFFRAAMQVWPRICSAMGPAFSLHLKDISPILLNAALIDIEAVTILGKENEIAVKQRQTKVSSIDICDTYKSGNTNQNQNQNESAVDNEDNITEIIHGTRRVAVNVSKQESKITAIFVIDDLCEELMQLFWPVLPTFFNKVIIGLIKFPYSTGVRKAVVESSATFIKAILSSIKFNTGATTADLHSMSLALIRSLVEIMCEDINANDINGKHKEKPIGSSNNGELMSQSCKSLTEILQLLRENVLQFLSVRQLETIVSSMFKCIEQSKNRITYMNTLMKQKNQNFDQIDELALDEEQSLEDDLLYHLSVIIAQFIKIYKNDFLAVFQNGTIMKSMISLLQYNQKNDIASSYVHKTSVYILCDIYEQCSATNVSKYLQLFVPLILQILDVDQKNFSVCQACFYCLGIMVSKCPLESVQYLNNISQCCVQCISYHSQKYKNFDDQTDALFLGMVDNAMSTLCKIAKSIDGVHPDQRQQADLSGLRDKCLMVWLNHLPIKCDSVEAQICHEYLFALIQQKNTLILGDNLSNLQNIFKLFATFVGTKMSTAELDEVIKAFTKTCVKQQEQMAGQLSNEEKQILGLTNSNNN